MIDLITLTTDFGPGSCYVAAMKGVIYGLNPQAHVVDLSHQIPPQDLRYTGFFLKATVKYFRANTLHVVVVDPGVGSDRSILFVQLDEGFLLVPDNGCWTSLLSDSPEQVIQLTETRFWRREISSTFHGRDIFAPVAGHLSLGLDPTSLGEPASDWKPLPWPLPEIKETQLVGEVVFIDDFGNLITNLPGELLRAWWSQPIEIFLKETEVRRKARTYAEGNVGEPLVLISSMDTVEVALNQGNAAHYFQSRVGDLVTVTLKE